MMRPLRELAEALRVDLEWIREHTRLGELAQRWQSRNRSEDLLLRGDDLVAAKAWSVKRKPDAPEITELQRDFFQASEQAEIARAAESKVARRGTWRKLLRRAIGVFFVIFGAIALFLNETSAVNFARAIDEGARFVVEGDPNRIDPANEGKLVHVSGELKTTARLVDPDFAMSAEAALLLRDAEMYYWWDENKKEPSWSAERSDRPHPPFRFPGMKVTAHDATLGAFRPGKLVLEKLPATIHLPIEPATVEAARTHVGGPVELTNGKLYLGSNSAQPQIGDIRISWRIAKSWPGELDRAAGRDGPSCIPDQRRPAAARAIRHSFGNGDVQDRRAGEKPHDLAGTPVRRMFYRRRVGDGARARAARPRSAGRRTDRLGRHRWRVAPISAFRGSHRSHGDWHSGHHRYHSALAIPLCPGDPGGLSNRETADITRAVRLAFSYRENTKPHVADDADVLRPQPRKYDAEQRRRSTISCSPGKGSNERSKATNPVRCLDVRYWHKADSPWLFVRGAWLDLGKSP